MSHELKIGRVQKMSDIIFLSRIKVIKAEDVAAAIDQARAEV